MSSWMFSDQQIYIYNTDNVINLDLYSENGEWDITSTSAAELKRTLHGFPMSAVSFTVEVERKYNYYVLNMILPVIILAFLGPFVFLLQIESGEQNGYSLTVLLSMSVVMTTVSDNIPPTANNVCILSVYLLTTYVLCALETLIVVIMTRMHNYTEKGYEPGWRTQRVVNVIAKATCYRRSGEERTSIKIGSKVGIVEIEDEKKTWANGKESPRDEERDDNDRRQYSYQECVYVINFFNFVVFSIVNSLTMLIFMCLLSF
ncbi:CHRNA7-FAM7A fusion protein-like [Mercenaria mercenaria]|uniref:CHRNA7-FAM7A fusion protein-like n=1 Tax=Mercenaria mercenaria TaxID=6596 RepID=UPI00234E58E4|nr:CHRNA7-FAM7A fusion protein-like [Mercenaria mercenaria]